MTSATAAMELDPPNALNRKGFALVPEVLSGAEIDHLRSILDLDQAPARARRAGRTFGARNLLDLSQVRAVAAHPAVRALVEPVVGSEAIAVRALFFDKTPEANWPVLWHQDLTIAVAARHDRDGWGPWSIKAGVTHVEPPPELLAAMLTVRHHLEDCHADNGPLRVLPRQSYARPIGVGGRRRLARRDPRTRRDRAVGLGAADAPASRACVVAGGKSEPASGAAFGIRAPRRPPAAPRLGK